MLETDLILLHPPSVYDFRKKSIMYGPISDVVPSTPIFEMYPIGFVTIAQYLRRYGYSVRIINVALKMLKNARFDVEKLIRRLNPLVFGIDLHWLVHAQGGLELAKMVRKYHPETPVIFGGISASYYHEELIRYPQVDYVIRGDSAEEPLRRLLQVIKQKELPEHVPNLTWQSNGRVQVNELSYLPTNLDDISFDYRTIMKSSVRYNDLEGYLPFHNWLSYPIVAAITRRGCKCNCVTCGGAAQASQRICGRKSPACRSPKLLAADISMISRHLRGPIFILGDIRQAGAQYTQELLSRLKEEKINNHIALELFSPASKEFLEMVSWNIPNFNLQISPESHDEEIRKAFGRNYNNKSLEATIENALNLGCKRIDLFFMIGLPKQTPQSVRDTIKYCDMLLEKYSKGNGTAKVRPHISPLAPFLDPGSQAFEDPQRYGYRLFYKTLEEHRQALLAPSWKYTLNYETEWMSRDELVNCIYEAALQLNQLKAKYGLVKRKEAKRIEAQIKVALDLTCKIDDIMSIKDREIQRRSLRELGQQFNSLSSSTICKNEELWWTAGRIKFNFPRIIQTVLAETWDITRPWIFRKGR
jgi:B12-binding domain/radical SAM domain protein